MMPGSMLLAALAGIAALGATAMAVIGIVIARQK
jgi:hypothetical protein